MLSGQLRATWREDCSWDLVPYPFHVLSLQHALISNIYKFPKGRFFHHLTLYLFCNQGEEVCLGSRWHRWRRGSTFGGIFFVLSLEYTFSGFCILFMSTIRIWQGCWRSSTYGCFEAGEERRSTQQTGKINS